MYTGLWVSFVFCLSPQLWMHLRATSGRILMNLFFRRHRNTRVLDMSYAPNQIYSNIRFQNISSWSDICNICLAFWTECDGISSTSFSKIGLCKIIRQESTILQTFLSCVVQIEIASPTACDQGQNLSRGFMFSWGPPWVSTIDTWKRICRIYYILQPTCRNPLVNIPPAQWKNNMLFKVLRVQHEDIFQKQLAEVRKLKSKPRLEGKLFGFLSWLVFSK